MGLLFCNLIEESNKNVHKNFMNLLEMFVSSLHLKNPSMKRNVDSKIIFMKGDTKGCTISTAFKQKKIEKGCIKKWWYEASRCLIVFLERLQKIHFLLNTVNSVKSSYLGTGGFVDYTFFADYRSSFYIYIYIKVSPRGFWGGRSAAPAL